MGLLKDKINTIGKDWSVDGKYLFTRLLAGIAIIIAIIALIRAYYCLTA